MQLPNGEVKVQGPLRIYWGLSRPIQLRQCDDVPAPPIAKWRHSLCVNLNDGAAQNNNTPPQKLHTQGVSTLVLWTGLMPSCLRTWQYLLGGVPGRGRGRVSLLLTLQAIFVVLVLVLIIYNPEDKGEPLFLTLQAIFLVLVLVLISDTAGNRFSVGVGVNI